YAATHETGHQAMMTGYRFAGKQQHPHMGAVVSQILGQNSDLPANMILPGPIGNTGVNESHGQGAAHLGRLHEPWFLNSDPADAAFSVGRLTLPAGPIAPRQPERRQ